MCVSQIHRHTPDWRREEENIYLYSLSVWPEKWTQDVMIVVFQNEALNSALVLEISSLSQLSLFLRNAWLREP